MGKVIFFCLTVFFITACSSDDGGSTTPETTELSGPYLGQTPPGITPAMFLSEIIREEVHSTTIFTPDGNEVYWTPMDGSSSTKYMKVENGYWTGPYDLRIGTSTDVGESFITYDGSRIYFTSWRSHNVTGILQKENIWCATRTDEGWGNPVLLSSIVNGLDVHWSFSLTESGKLYFSGHPLGADDTNDIYCAEFENGSVVRKTRLNDSINTAGSEDTPFIARDESYLIFARVPDFNSYADLFICFKNEDGSWDEPINMNHQNTYSHELCPYVTFDGEYLFFMSMRTGMSKPYWVSAEVIEDYR